MTRNIVVPAMMVVYLAGVFLLMGGSTWGLWALLMFLVILVCIWITDYRDRRGG